MKTRVVAAVIVAAIVAALSAPARAARTFAPDGPYEVGVMTGYTEFDGRDMAIMVWYPAEPAPGSAPYDYSGITGAAVLEAEPYKAFAPYPLILFSHGMGACASQSVYYTENLASMGYVVAGPDHKDSIMCHIDREPDITPADVIKAAILSGFDLSGAVMRLFKDKFEEMGYEFTYRPREASAAIDRVLQWNRDPSHPLHGMIDPERIGATGHSLGGYTTLMVGGLPFICEDTPPGECGLDKAGPENRPDPCCLEAYRDLDPFELRDERVKAILPLGPALLFPGLARAARAVEVPHMTITGDSKRMEVPLEPVKTFYDNAPGPKYLIVLKNTDHMTIADMTLNVPLAKAALPGFRRGYREKAQAYKDYSAEFFDLYLKGCRSGKGIVTRQNRFVQLWMEE